MFKEKMENTWEWIKEHKRAIFFGTAAVVMSVGGIAIIKHLPKTGLKIDEVKKDIWPKTVKLTDFGVGSLDDVMRYENGMVEMWLDEIPLEDMGKLGEEIMAKIPDIPEHSTTWALLSIKPNPVI